MLFEIKEKFPSLSLSFSNKEFISMKGPTSVKTKIVKKEIIFALRVGIFQSKTETPDSTLESIEVSKNSFWNYKKLTSCVDFLPFYPSKVHPPQAPARAYSKILEATELFDLNIVPSDTIIEIGSAPGGISYFLLELGAKVIAIDPAKMHPTLFENYPSKLTHDKRSIFDIEEEDLPRNFQWVISDLNLTGGLNVSQSCRIMDFCPKLKGAFLTIKTPDPENIKNFENWKQLFTKKFRVQVVNLPSHKKEIGFILKRRG